MKKLLQVFCCYAREDQSYLLLLKKYLTPLERAGLIVVQADVDVSPGEEWEQKISYHLNTAHIILLLVSPDFVASEYCYSVEMRKAMERHDSGEARVVPLILRPVRFQQTPFGKLRSLPTDAQPITKWPNLDEAFLDVTNGIEKVIEKLLIQSQLRNNEALLSDFGIATLANKRLVKKAPPDWGLFLSNSGFLRTGPPTRSVISTVTDNPIPE